MSKEDDNKALVGRWFTDFWGENCDLQIVDELAAPDMLLQYSLHEPRRGHADIKAFMTGFREAFPNLAFTGAADLIAEGDYVVGRWIGGGTHTGPAFSDFLMGSLPASTGKKMRFTGTTVLRIVNGKITEEIGLDDGVTALHNSASYALRDRGHARLVDFFIFNAFGSPDSITRARRSKTSRKRSEVLILDGLRILSRLISHAHLNIMLWRICRESVS
jgi:predicted ester cyclase